MFLWVLQWVTAGIKPKQYENFEELKKNASKQELLTLTNHSNGVVRCYSFWALASNKNARFVFNS